MPQEDKLLSSEGLREAWPNRPTWVGGVHFEHRDVPPAVQALIPYAEIWGISDDWLRDRVLAATPAKLVEHLKEVVASYDDDLDEWLAGPESFRTPLTDAYVAFSSMRIGTDCL